MNDRQLQYILEIAKEENLTAAAKNLYVSQPSLSNLLEHVESELGLRLFERRPGCMKLTAAGERYVAAARKIMGTMAQFERELVEIQDEERGRLTIGCSRKKSASIFPYIVPRLREKYPLYKFNLVEGSMEALAEMLTSGEIDVAFLYKDFKLSHIQSYTCSKEEVCIIAPIDFFSDKICPQENGIDILTDLSTLADKEFVLFKKGLSLRALADEIFRRCGISPVIALETESWQTCIAMVECGAFTLLPFSPLENEIYLRNRGGKLLYKPLMPEKNYYRILRACYREELVGSRILQDFLAICAAMEQSSARFGD